MPITYDKISFPKIEQNIKKILDNDFPNVYVGSKLTMLGNETIRINLLSSSSEDLATNFEVRTYNVLLRYYTTANMDSQSENEAVKNRIDRIKKALIDNQVRTTDNAWAKLEVMSITYDISDEENEDEDNIYITEFDLEVTNYNQF